MGLVFCGRIGSGQSQQLIFVSKVYGAGLNIELFRQGGEDAVAEFFYVLLAPQPFVDCGMAFLQAIFKECLFERLAYLRNVEHALLGADDFSGIVNHGRAEIADGDFCVALFDHGLRDDRSVFQLGPGNGTVVGAAMFIAEEFVAITAFAFGTGQAGHGRAGGIDIGNSEVEVNRMGRHGQAVEVVGEKLCFRQGIQVCRMHGFEPQDHVL